MTSDLPQPLTPPDCDLKDFPGTMIYRHRLRGSTFNATATDSEFRAGINLWLNAQDQVPAGSLPDNDIELCRLADLGRDQKRWKKIKSVAMRGWFRCADGRLYNRVVAEVVNAQWQIKLDQRNKTLKARIAALEKRQEQATDPAAKDDIGELLARLRADLQQWQARLSHRSNISNVPEPVTGSVTDSVAASKRREEKEREGKGLVLVPSSYEDGQAPPADPIEDEKPQSDIGATQAAKSNTKPPDPWVEVYRYGREILGQNAGGTITLLRHFFNQKPRKVLAKLEDAAEQRDSVTYINAFLWANVERLPPGSHVGPVARLP